MIDRSCASLATGRSFPRSCRMVPFQSLKVGLPICSMYFLILLLLFFNQIVHTSQAASSDSDNHGSDNYSMLDKRGGAPRSVYLISSVYISGPSVYSSSFDHLVLAAHAALEFGGTDTDGGFRIDLIVPAEGQYSIRATDVGLYSPYAPPIPFMYGYIDQDVAALGQTTLTNNDLVDPDTGNGIVANAWGSDHSFRIVGHNSINLVQSLTQFLNFTIPDQHLTYYSEASEYTKGRGLSTVYDNVHIQRLTFGGTNLTNPFLKEFAPGADGTYSYIQNPSNPSADVVNGRGDTDPTTPFNSQRILGHPNDPNSVCGGVSKLGQRDLANDPCSNPANGSVPKLRLGGPSQNVALAKIRGELTVVTQLSEELIEWSGKAALLSAPIVIILDLVNGQWKAATFAAVGLAVGIALDLAITGPIGFIVGAAVAVLFAILPGLFKPDVNPPSNNVAQIVQFTFFGDKSHTGNENCNANLKKIGQPQNCTALYGPGVLANVFKWEPFDAIAFMIHYNDGHSMSILDIAAALYPVDFTKPGDGNGAVSTVSCGEYHQRLGGRDTTFSKMTGLFKRYVMMQYGGATTNRTAASISEGYPCSKPVYALKRNMITIPVINKTADVIANHIIGPNGGECKLLADAPEGLLLEGYNLTLTGRPCAIACNFTGGGNEVVQNTIPVANSSGLSIPTATDSSQSSITDDSAATATPTVPFLINATTSSNSSISATDVSASLLPSDQISSTVTASAQSTSAPIIPPSASGYQFQSCNTDSLQTRALRPRIVILDSMTVEQCASDCAGSVYFGLENGKECYCGNFIDVSSNVTSNSACNMPCQGNTTEACGNQMIIQIYKYFASTYVSSGNTTSDNSTGRAQVLAPQAQGLKNLTSDNGLCITSSTGVFCFPNGTFYPQTGSMGFNMKQATDLNMPSGSVMNYPIIVPLGHGNSYNYETRSFTSNQYYSATKTFSYLMTQLAGFGDQTWSAVLANASTQAVCLYSSTQFKGDARCYGVSGGNLTSEVAGKAQSLSIHGGAAVWVYPRYYNDPGGAYLTASVADLNDIPYSTNSNFKNLIKALWISSAKPGVTS